MSGAMKFSLLRVMLAFIPIASALIFGRWFVGSAEATLFSFAMVGIPLAIVVLIARRKDADFAVGLLVGLMIWLLMFAGIVLLAELIDFLT